MVVRKFDCEILHCLYLNSLRLICIKLPKVLRKKTFLILVLLFGILATYDRIVSITPRGRADFWLPPSGSLDYKQTYFVLQAYHFPLYEIRDDAFE